MTAPPDFSAFPHTSRPFSFPALPLQSAKALEQYHPFALDIPSAVTRAFPLLHSVYYRKQYTQAIIAKKRQRKTLKCLFATSRKKHTCQFSLHRSTRDVRKIEFAKTSSSSSHSSYSPLHLIKLNPASKASRCRVINRSTEIRSLITSWSLPAICLGEETPAPL